jgi:hypothetical protein
MPASFGRKGRLGELFGPERLLDSLLSSRFEQQFEMVAGPGVEPTCGYLAMSRTTRFESPTPHFGSTEIEHSSRVGSPVLRIKPPHRRSDNEKFCSNFNCSKSGKMSEPELKTLQNLKTSKLNTRVHFPSASRTWCTAHWWVRHRPAVTPSSDPTTWLPNPQ